MQSIVMNDQQELDIDQQELDIDTKKTNIKTRDERLRGGKSDYATLTKDYWNNKNRYI